MQITTTLGINRQDITIYEPESIDELKKDFVNYSSRFTNISVTSGGKNWGYGCHAPNADQSLLIHLKKCNRIIEFDNYHGIITLEPGVTYGQLALYLEEKGDEWIAPVHGGGPDCSVIGNAMERGYGITQHTDHFGAVITLEAILNDGSIYVGSLKKLGLERLDKLFKYGVGPYLDPIFTQSGVGIVTQATIRLAKKPSYVEMFYYFLEDEASLQPSVEAIKKSKLTLGSLVGGINLINRERCLSMLIDYPLEKILSRAPLSEEEMIKEAKKNMITPWLVVGMLYGEKRLVKESRKIIENNFAGIKKRKFYFNTNNRKLYQLAQEVLRRINITSFDRSLTSMNMAYDVLYGKPNNVALKLAYWKNENKELVKNDNLNPNRDKCGLIWYAPLVELTASSVQTYCEFIKEASKKFNINSLITLTTIDDLCFDSTVPILFNSNDSKDRENACKYYEYLIEEGKKLGFFPYRLNIESQKKYNLNNSILRFNLINEARYNN